MDTESWENSSFEGFLRQRMKDAGFNLKKLSEASGIAIKHLEGLANGNFKSLPSAPYVRGYLLRLGGILDFDTEIWWKKLKASGMLKDSLNHDSPPKNRFSKKSVQKFAAAGIALLALLIYFVSRYASILGKPTITITSPDRNPAIATTNQIVISGTLKDAGVIYINGESVSVDQNGAWQKTVLLQSGINSLEIKASKFLGGETKIIEQIIYQPQQTSSPTTGF